MQTSTGEIQQGIKKQTLKPRCRWILSIFSQIYYILDENV
jgi:hypothetical protein